MDKDLLGRAKKIRHEKKMPDEETADAQVKPMQCWRRKKSRPATCTIRC
jgi:hypothetical protein